MSTRSIIKGSPVTGAALSGAVIIAIDPGVSGGMAAFSQGRFECAPFTGEGDAVAWLRRFDPESTTAWMEDVHSSPQMGVRSAFTFGRNAGFWTGSLAALGIPLRLVKPQVWQRGVPGISGRQGPERKAALKGEACRRFPTHNVTHATADALLLADWARSHTCAG